MEFDALVDKYNLAHFGVKGMHWGVRRDRGSNGRVTTATKKHPSDTHAKDPSPHTPGGLDGDKNTSADHERVTKAMAKMQERGKSSLSNEELKAIANRIEAEKKLRQLTEDQKSEMQKAVEQMQLEKQYSQLMAERAKATRSTGRKIVDALAKQAVETATQQAAGLGEQMLKDALGIKPSKTEVMKKQIDTMRVQRDHAQLKKDLKNLGVVNPSANGSAFKVNKNKVTFTPTSLNGVSRVKP